MAKSDSEADKLLDVYVHNYMVKNNYKDSAESFMSEAKLAPDAVAIDGPGGSLFEWWCVFWDLYIARTDKNHSEAATTYLETQRIKQKEQLKMERLEMMLQTHLQQRGSGNPIPGGKTNVIGNEGIPGQSNAVKTSQSPLDAQMPILRPATNHPSKLVQGNYGRINVASQQIQDIRSEVNLDPAQRALHIDPASIYGQGITQSKPGIGNAGLNPGADTLPLKGWPLTDIDQVQPSLGAQVQRPLSHGASQFQLLPQQQQQLLVQVQAQGNLVSSPIYGNMDPMKLRGTPSGNLQLKDTQQNANDGSLFSPIHSVSNKNARKRKGLADSTGNSQLLTPSTHTPGEGTSVVGNSQHVNSNAKGTVMYDALASSRNQMEENELLGDVSYKYDTDDNDRRDLLSTLKRNSSERAEESSKGFSFNEVGSICKTSGRVICCHFSTDGKLLASGGYDKKVVIGNMETLQTECSVEEHDNIITDVRFRPNTTQLATSSFDGTIRLWDAANPRYSLQTYTGHTANVTSLDFHPTMNDFFCSCDANNEMRFWHVNNSCSRISKGGNFQVRFQPRVGTLLAAASENVVSIFDIETDSQTRSLQSHATQLQTLCWNANGDLLVTVSEDCVRVWSLSSWECVHELSSTGVTFHSCVFHPSYPNLLIVGGYQSMELWNLVENKCMTIPAHGGILSGLAQSPATGMVASAGHDGCVKLWK